MPEYDLMDQTILVALWVGLLYGLFGLAVGWLALTDLEWRQEIAARLRATRLGLARGFRWLRN
jgi:gamma-glutamylcysteine synthetase